MIDYCTMELDVTESDPCGWWLMIGWNMRYDPTLDGGEGGMAMDEEWIFFPVTDDELDTYNLTEESWR